MNEPDAVAALWAWLDGVKDDGKKRTQADLAVLLEASPQSVWRWLHRRFTPDYTTIKLAERKLGIPAGSWPESGQAAPAEPPGTEAPPAPSPRHLVTTAIVISGTDPTRCGACSHRQHNDGVAWCLLYGAPTVTEPDDPNQEPLRCKACLEATEVQS